MTTPRESFRAVWTELVEPSIQTYEPILEAYERARANGMSERAAGAIALAAIVQADADLRLAVLSVIALIEFGVE